ncbi:MAG: TolC family protein [Isosphaeraceae bacterium]
MPAGAAPAPADARSVPVGNALDSLIRLALEQNRTVQAARFNAMSLAHRVPQVTALDDPVLSNSVFPIPSVAPQYSLMGYMPYEALLAQQFPWFGTLRLRGQAAQADVDVALFELAATQLDVVAAVKRAYCDLYLGERALAIVEQNRKLATEYLALARERFNTAGAWLSVVLLDEAAIGDIDREHELAVENLVEARAELIRQAHLAPGTPVQVGPMLPLPDVPGEIDRLRSLAVTCRPELRGRLAAIARDDRGIELARKRYYPNLTLGLVYQDMEKTNSVSPQTAMGMPNVGFFVGLNLPIYRKKLAAGVCEAQARAAADTMLYEAERDEVLRDVEALLTRVQARARSLAILRESNRPRSAAIAESAAADYRAGNLDYLGLLGAQRDVLRVELQIAEAEAELGKSLAALERAVGAEINEHPPMPPDEARLAPAPNGPGPFAPANSQPAAETPSTAPTPPTVKPGDALPSPVTSPSSESTDRPAAAESETDRNPPAGGSTP